MTPSRARTRPAWFDTLIVTSATAACAIAAAFVVFSAFMVYDDEGYVLLSLRNFAEHGGLYRDVYTQYGPFPFVLYSGLQALGLPLTHAAGRLITIGAWSGAAISCAMLARQATRSLVAQLAVLAAVFLYLWVMASEPTHPGGLIVLLTSLMAALGYRWIETDKLVRWSILVGATTAALLLTKINIGVFAAFSAGAWLLLHHRYESVRRWAPFLVGGLAVLLPLGLMRPLLHTPWVQTYALVFATSAVALVIAIAMGGSSRAGWRMLGVGLLAAALMAAVTLGIVFVRGTTPGDLLEGLLLGPLRQPVNFSLRFLWPPGIRWIAAASLAACIAACLLRRHHRARVDGAVASLRLLTALGLAINVVRFPLVSPDYLVLGAALPCLWFFAWPLAGEAPARNAARAWIALLLLGQSLHAFPVPGSQIAWGTVLTIPLAAIGAWEAATWFARQNVFLARTARGIRFAAVTAVVAFTTLIGWKFGHLALRYREGQNLSLPGAELIRLPDDSAALMRVLTGNAAAHADVLFSLPGMFSFNIWTDLPTPTHANVTHWFSLLSAARQEAIIDELEKHPRACVIIDRGHVDFLIKRNLAPKGPLHDYIAQRFEPAFTVDHFEFCVRRGRRIEPFLLAEELTRAPDADNSHIENTLLKCAWLVPPAQPIARVELAPADPAVKPLTLDASNARVEVAPANPRGEPIGPARAVTWPLQLSGPSIVFIYYDRERLPAPAREATVIVRDGVGDEIGLARLRR